MSKSWKEFLLRSGLPLENDVSKYLESRGCVGGYEYSYIREDEWFSQKEFSFDIDISYIKDAHFFDLLIECKYRHPSTSWIFTPEEYNDGPNRLRKTSFVHAIDFFVDLEFPFISYYPREIGPVCSKGIEITNNGNNEKSITQAILQLSYAMPRKIAVSIEYQVNNLLTYPHIFYHVPIIVTTANLYRLRDEVNIRSIETASELNDVADQYNILVLHNKVGADLKNFASKVYEEMIEDIGLEKFQEHNHSFTKDMNHFVDVLSTYYSGNAIVIVHFDREGKNLGKIIDFLDELVSPSKEILSAIKKHEKEMDEMMEDFKKGKSI